MPSSHRTTWRRCAALLGLLAACAWAPAKADATFPTYLHSNIYTGAQCMSAGPTVLYANGSRENDEIQLPNTSAGYQMFNCPIQMPLYFTPEGKNTTLYVQVDGRKGSHAEDLSCRLVVSDGQGNDTSTVVFTGAASVGLPPNAPMALAILAPRAAHLRCRVYSRLLNSSVRSAIHSYRVAIF